MDFCFSENYRRANLKGKLRKSNFHLSSIEKYENYRKALRVQSRMHFLLVSILHRMSLFSQQLVKFPPKRVYQTPILLFFIS